MSTQLTSDAQAASHGLFQESTTQLHPLGMRIISSDGRAYRYCKVGGTALVPGKLQQGPAEVTNHQNLTPSAAAIGDTSITVTLGNTAATANQYSEGWAIITITPGQGYQYRVKSHPSASGSASLTLQLEDPIEVALTTSSRVDLVANPYNGVIVFPTTATGPAVGVAVNDIASASYGWIQTHGPAAVLNDGGSTVGTNVSASNGVAGAVEAAVTAQAAVGYAMTGIADTDYGAVYLTLD